MLAIFGKSVADGPRDLKNTSDEGNAVGTDSLEHFSTAFPANVFIKMSDVPCCLAYSNDNPNHFVDRNFCVLKDIYCLFQGSVNNLSQMQKEYGLGRHIDAVVLMTEAYRTLRDREPFPARTVLKGFEGQFAFVIYDSSCKTVFAAVDADSSIPFYWGVDSKENLIFSNDMETIRKGCGNSYAFFPRGCFFSSDDGLQRFSAVGR